jgi:hypothetical protein
MDKKNKRPKMFHHTLIPQKISETTVSETTSAQPTGEFDALRMQYEVDYNC